jgi:hypothetical protein
MGDRPLRVQLRRTKGWRLPENTVSVARPGPFGNPFVAGEVTHVWHKSGAWPYALYRDGFMVGGPGHAVALYAHALKQDPHWYHDTWRVPDVSVLRGKNLACWCGLCDRHRDGKPLDEDCVDCAPCHVDPLGKLANQETPS